MKQVDFPGAYKKIEGETKTWYVINTNRCGKERGLNASEDKEWACVSKDGDDNWEKHALYDEYTAAEKRLRALANQDNAGVSEEVPDDPLGAINRPG